MTTGSADENTDEGGDGFRANPFHLDGRVVKQAPDFLQAMLDQARASARTPLVGVTTDGTPEPGLFALEATGRPTAAITASASAYLASLGPQARAGAVLPVDSEDWRLWFNIAPNLLRHGVLLEELDGTQREAALGMLRATLSESGFATARDIMRLNHTIAEMSGQWDLYGEWLYWVSVFGDPSGQQPWGFQVDGHHLITNCLVVGDQIVLTPLFWGGEPVRATSGRYAGTAVLGAEEAMGQALFDSLSADQRAVAVIGDQTPEEMFTAAFRDDFEMRYEGIAFDALDADQQGALLRLVELYVGRTRPEHAAVRMTEVERHLDRTRFAWIGGGGPEAVFYYRIHSPVILIEFDHLAGVAFDNDEATRRHVHTVVRTPNGNDYGRDLLRQHRERHHGAAGAGHGRGGDNRSS